MVISVCSDLRLFFMKFCVWVWMSMLLIVVVLIGLVMIGSLVVLVVSW